jgi:NAD(P)-dependent dehydrogenase (short-subunit alcohol dehydrogenase family)
VTGASSGIGRELVRELAHRGWLVGATARRAELLDALAAGSPGRVLAVPADVTDRAAMLDAAAGVREALGPIDLAILNAAYWQRFSVAAWDTDVLRRHFDTNVMGMVHGVEAVLADMRRRRSGTIVGTASVAGYRGLPDSEGYGASKAAEIHLLESLRLDLRPAGIRVITVCPGFVRTDLTARNTFPMPWMVDPDDAARRILDGVARGKPEIVFPLPMMLAAKAVRVLPVRAYAWGFRFVPRRSGQP